VVLMDSCPSSVSDHPLMVAIRLGLEIHFYRALQEHKMNGYNICKPLEGAHGSAMRGNNMLHLCAVYNRYVTYLGGVCMYV
jgi:hypothetical protein